MIDPTVADALRHNWPRLHGLLAALRARIVPMAGALVPAGLARSLRRELGEGEAMARRLVLLMAFALPVTVRMRACTRGYGNLKTETGPIAGADRPGEPRSAPQDLAGPVLLRLPAPTAASSPTPLRTPGNPMPPPAPRHHPMTAHPRAPQRTRPASPIPLYERLGRIGWHGRPRDRDRDRPDHPASETGPGPRIWSPGAHWIPLAAPLRPPPGAGARSVAPLLARLEALETLSAAPGPLARRWARRLARQALARAAEAADPSRYEPDPHTEHDTEHDTGARPGARTGARPGAPTGPAPLRRIHPCALTRRFARPGPYAIGLSHLHDLVAGQLAPPIRDG